MSLLRHVGVICINKKELNKGAVDKSRQHNFQDLFQDQKTNNIVSEQFLGKFLQNSEISTI